MHLHADDPGGGLRHAGLRPHRRPALGGLRRLFAQLPGGPNSRRGLPNGHHRRRRRARRPAGAAEAKHGNRLSLLPRSAYGHHGQAHGRGGSLARGPGPLVRGAGGGAAGTLPAGRHGQRGPAVRALHLRLHRPAQGSAAQHRRLPAARRHELQVHIRLPRWRHPLVYRGRRLDHRPFLHRLWSLGQRRHDPDVRGGAHLPRRLPLLASGR